MSPATLGLLHPGAMGATVGAAARASGADVLWASNERSAASRARAEAAGLAEVATLADVVDRSDVVLSVCPPHAARALAERVVSAGFQGLYIDGNAVAPNTAREIATRVQTAGADYVDGGIIGPPASRPGTTRLYLSGARAAEVARYFEAGALEVIALDGPACAASALKMSFAAWTKGSAALLSSVRALAAHEGVSDALLSEWSRSLPELPGRSEGGLRATAPKAWRFVGEMHEIAASFEAAGLPDGFHRAAADVYERLSGYKDLPPPSLEDALRALLTVRSDPD